MAEQLNFEFQTKSDLVLSVADLKSRFFLGIPIVTPSGDPMPDEDIETYIRAAQSELETILDIKLRKQVITESKDFIRDHYKNWGYIKATYPVLCIHEAEGHIGGVKQTDFPVNWLSIKETSDEVVHRTINIVPTNNSGVVDHGAIYTGIYPQLGYHGNARIPNYWRITYTTGFEVIPDDLLKVVGMMAAMPIFDLLGDLIIGAGIASQSIGVDGFSQSISTTSSAENSGYSSRIKSYQSHIKILMPDLKKKYTGFTFMSM